MSAGAGGRGRIVLVTLVAVLATAGSVAWSEHSGNSSHTLPEPAGAYRSARVSPVALPSGTSSCGVQVGPASTGIRHPDLPCGVELYVEYRGTTVLTQVLDNGPTGADDFRLTTALADLLGIHGRVTVRWRFAR